MKAARIHRFGAPEVIVIDELSRPVPAADEVLVRVRYAGVGPWDTLIRENESAVDSPLPITLGSDLSGIVEAAGPRVAGFKAGDEVYGVTNPQFIGASAEFALASVNMIAHKHPVGLLPRRGFYRAAEQAHGIFRPAQVNAACGRDLASRTGTEGARNVGGRTARSRQDSAESGVILRTAREISSLFSLFSAMPAEARRLRVDRQLRRHRLPFTRTGQTRDNRHVAITNPHPLLSDEIRRRIEDLARQENREPSDVLEEAVRRYAAASRLDRLSERLEKSARDSGISEEDVPSLVDGARRESQLRGR